MFLDNKYTKIYNQIINRAQIRTEIAVKYVERHHILPKSLGGGDSTQNIVALTPREHYICHALLPKMVEGDSRYKMYCAFNMMHVDAHGNRYTSRLYEYYKVKFYRLKSENQKGKRKWTKEQRAKMSETRKGVPWSENARSVKRSKPTAKPVLVYRKGTGEFVGEWESINLCAKELHLDPSAIWKICKGNWVSCAPDGKMHPYKSHKGYTFQYKNQ